jgi:intraflagellar transport protein 140
VCEQIRTTQGTIKQSLTFAADEGEPIGIELCGHFLTVATLLGWVKVWDLSRREAKLHANPKYLNDVILDFGEIILARYVH